MELSTIVPLTVLAALLIYVIGIHHRLVTLGKRYRHAFVQIEVQLKRHHALVAELIEATRGALADEREALTAITLAHNEAESALAAAASRPGDAWAMARLGRAEEALGVALARLRALVEASPGAEASVDVRRLGEALEHTGSRIAFACDAFADAVMQYNHYRRRFPRVLLAGVFGHGGDAAPLSRVDGGGPRPEARGDA